MKMEKCVPSRPEKYSTESGRGVGQGDIPANLDDRKTIEKNICKVCNTNRSRFSLLTNWSLQVCDAINTYIESRWSVLMYDSESWFTTLADRRRLDVFDMSCQMLLLCVF